MKMKLKEIFKRTIREPNKKNPIEYLFRIMSLPFVKVLVKTPITPNQITLLGALVWVVSVVIIYLNKGFYFDLFAAIFFSFSFVIDFCDGGIARLKNVVSDWGKYLDGYLDTFRNIFIFLVVIHRVFILSTAPIILYLGFIYLVLDSTFGSLEGYKSAIFFSRKDKKTSGEMIKDKIGSKSRLIDHLLNLYTAFDTTLFFLFVPFLLLFRIKTLEISSIFFMIFIISKLLRLLMTFYLTRKTLKAGH